MLGKKILLGVIIAISVVLAYFHWFTYDDAYITFRYAQNLIDGYGPVYNPGDEPVEGYTDFLWMIMSAVAMKFGLSPEVFSLLLGLLSMGLTLVLTFKLSEYITGSRWMPLVVVFLLGTNYSFFGISVMGLETQFQAFWILLSVYYMVKILDEGINYRYVFIISVAQSIAILLHPDSGIFAIAFVGVLIYIHRIYFGKIITSRFFVWFLWYIVPVILLIGPWFVWKVWYYGSLIPNTYYAKTKAITGVIGVYFIVMFALSYFLVPEFYMIFILFIKSVLKKTKIDKRVFFLLVLLVLWFLYIIKVDGDFMEFRFMLPIMPVLFVVIGWLFEKLIGNDIVKIALILSLITGNVHHYIFAHGIQLGSKFVRKIIPGILMMPPMAKEELRWIRMGKKLYIYFKGDSTITISTSAAGALPFYSHLKNIDILGLNDKWVAKNAKYRRTGSAAHRLMTPLSYVISRGVNLFIEHPRMIYAPDQKTFEKQIRKFNVSKRMKFTFFDQPFPSNARVLGIPICQDSVMMAVYLSPHPKIDSLINAEHWFTCPVSFLGADADSNESVH